MGKKELKQINSDLEIHVVDLISKFDPSKTSKFTQFLIKKLRDSWDEAQPKKLRLRDRDDSYEIPSGGNRVEQQIIYYLNEVFGEENLKALHSLHNHMENNRVEGEKDINQYKSWEEIQKANALATLKYEQKRLEKEVMSVIETDDWLIIRPLTFQSSLTYGYGTKWCTASRGNKDYFYKYSQNGVLVYAINKKDGDKYGVFYDMHNNRGEFSLWNAPDVRIDSVESTIPGDLMKTIYQYMKKTEPNYEYFSVEEKDRSHDYYGKKSLLSDVVESLTPMEARDMGEDMMETDVWEDADVEMEEGVQVSNDNGEDLTVVWRGNMEGEERVYEYVETQREERAESARDPWTMDVPQNREWGGEESERRA
jgi:hypothetical protein